MELEELLQIWRNIWHKSDFSQFSLWSWPDFSQFHFSQPLWLLGSLIPLFVWWFALRYLPVHRRLNRYADPHLLPHLLLNTSTTTSRNGLNIWTLLWLLGLLALAGPRWDYQEQELPRPRLQLMIVLDLSKSMLVKDLPHSRLEQAKQEIEELLNTQQIYLGLMIFARFPHLVMPFSDDYQNLRYLLPTLTPELLPKEDKGSQLSVALQSLERWLHGQPGKKSHVLLISDGEFEPKDLQASLTLIRKGNFYFHALGVGTAQGKPIELADGRWQRDAEGRIVMSQLKPTYLQQLAQAGKGIYQQASYRTDDTQAILNHVKQDLETIDDTHKSLQKLWHERFYLLVIAIMLLLLPFFRPHIIHSERP